MGPLGFFCLLSFTFLGRRYQHDGLTSSTRVDYFSTDGRKDRDQAWNDHHTMGREAEDEDRNAIHRNQTGTGD